MRATGVGTHVPERAPQSRATGVGARVKTRVAAALLCATAAAATLAALPGCGAKFELPTERRQDRVIPSDRSYQMEATWTGMSGVHDILLTPAGQLFVVFNHGGSGPASRGEVQAFARLASGGSQTPLPNYPFRTLFNPVAIAQGDSSLFVLDQGDTCLARTNPANGSCGASETWNNDVVDLRYYWRVREFNLVGKARGGLDTASTFTDTSMAFVDGIAADDLGRVYLSGTIIRYVVDQVDSRIFTRTFLKRIQRYARGPRYPGVTPNDPNMPGAAWHRDTTWIIEDGDGGGFIGDPRGLHWRSAGGTRALYEADAFKNQAQKLYDNISSTPFFVVDSDGGGERMASPTDVFADELGSVYVADTGNRRVLRYLPDGSFVQRVDVERDAQGQELVEPVAVAADSSLVFVGDRSLGKVIRYRRRQ